MSQLIFLFFFFVFFSFLKHAAAEGAASQIAASDVSFEGTRLPHLRERGMKGRREQGEIAPKTHLKEERERKSVSQKTS